MSHISQQSLRLSRSCNTQRNFETTMNLAASVAVRNTNNVWVEDNMVFNCHQCKKRFGLLLRKHHCRRCGNIFCYDCSNYFTTIPDFVTDCPEPGDRWNFSHYITSLQSTEQRVCRLCYETIKQKITYHNKILQMLDNPPELEEIRSLPFSQTEIKTHYYDTLRNIQYCLPNHRYTSTEKKILLVNAKYFSKHSKYLVHLINSMDWNSSPSVTDTRLHLIGSVINGSKTKECHDLYCTRTCQETLSVDDCITVLHRGSSELPEHIIKYIFQLINKSPDIVILCHITFFVNLIITANQIMREMLFQLLNRSDTLRYSAFWHLSSSLVVEGTDQSNNIILFIDMFPKDQIRHMTRGREFFLGLMENINRAGEYLRHHDFTSSPIVLPYHPSALIIGVDLDTITVNPSCSRPVVIRFYFKETDNDNEYIYAARILFKPESVLNDVAVLNLMILSEIILREHVDENISTVTYNVMPITYSSGMIEIVEQSETIHAIETRRTILKHIVSKNEERSVGEALDRYLYSLVSYTLHSYFIGLGDRHLENIMITDDGSIFHIDFGFILGTDAHPFTSTDIKLNSNMIDVITDDEAGRHSKYLDLCSQGAVVLRKFFNMFYIILLQNKNLSDRHVEKFIMSRFQPRQSDEVIVTELLTVIEKSHGAYGQYIQDFLHTHSRQGTIQNGIAAVIGTAVNAVRTVTG
jgi:hypothetical protein